MLQLPSEAWPLEQLTTDSCHVAVLGRLFIHHSSACLGQLSFPSIWVGKWGPALAVKARAGMVYCIHGWTRGCAGKTVKFLDNACHTWALPRWDFFIKGRYTFTFLPSNKNVCQITSFGSTFVTYNIDRWSTFPPHFCQQPSEKLLNQCMNITGCP